MSAFVRKRGKGHVMRQRLSNAGLTRGTVRTLELHAIGTLRTLAGPLAATDCHTAEGKGVLSVDPHGFVSEKDTVSRSHGVSDGVQGRITRQLTEDANWTQE